MRRSGRLREQFQRLGAAAGLDDLVAEILQEFRDDDPDLGIVVHDHQLCAGRAPVRGEAVSLSVTQDTVAPRTSREFPVPVQISDHAST